MFGMSKYERNHVVPGGHTALFAVDGRVQCHFVRDGDVRPLSPRDVAVRCNFHAKGPGARGLAKEWEEAMSRIEQPAIEWMKAVDESWPPSDDDRGVMAEYLALQAVRGPAFRRFFEQARVGSLPEHKRGLRADQQEQLEEWSGSDHFRLESMQALVGRVGTLVGHLSWALMRFPGRRLLSSDHPLVPVAVLAGQSQPAAAMPRGGLLNTVEFRFPISPDRALLLCWRDDQDDFPVIEGKLHHLKALNTSVRDQADVQWFHRPDVSTPCASGSLTPISYQAFSDYSLQHAADSERRQLAEDEVNRMIESEERPRVAMLKAKSSTRHVIELGPTA
jgi:hypothetical protein